MNGLRVPQSPDRISKNNIAEYSFEKIKFAWEVTSNVKSNRTTVIPAECLEYKTYREILWLQVNCHWLQVMKLSLAAPQMSENSERSSRIKINL